ncbi:hypothetical protein A1F99_057490 [Pyrenophora tritici-repentis]|nr:hypothetical protein A1F99_057490 [Pyrenophora tritici-repentis]
MGALAKSQVYIMRSKGIEVSQEVANEIAASFSTSRFQDALKDWVVADNQSLRVIETPQFRAMIAAVSPLAEALLWPVANYLREARSLIHVSFDNWTSTGGQYAFTGLCVHYLNSEGKLVDHLLGLPELHGAHTGNNIAAAATTILRLFGVDNARVGYFVLDNASNNDTAVESLAEEFGFIASERRLRCCCHILNLSAQLVIWGKDRSAYENEAAHLEEEEKYMDEWRKYGPVGVLFDVIASICTPQTRQLLERLQCEEAESLGVTPHIRQLVKPVKTRWNSYFNTFVRAAELHGPIDGYIECKLEEHSAATATSRRRKNHRLKDVNYEDLDAPEDHLITNVNLAHCKLAKYYAKFDNAPVYYTATILHPHYKHHLSALWKVPDTHVTARDGVHYRDGWLDNNHRAFLRRTKNPLTNRSDQPPVVSTRISWHLKALNQTLTIAARAILPAWKTYPGWALFRDAGLPSALIMLEEAKLRFALHLQVVDKNHPLTARIKISVIPKGRGAGGLQKPHSKVQRLGLILPTIPRHTLIAPHYSPGCRTDPTNGIAKAEAAKLFTKWWDTLTNQDVTIFSDGSEQRTDGERFVTYGYAIYQAQTQIAIGRGSLNPQSHVFDAEASLTTYLYTIVMEPSTPTSPSPSNIIRLDLTSLTPSPIPTSSPTPILSPTPIQYHESPDEFVQGGITYVKRAIIARKDFRQGTSYIWKYGLQYIRDSDKKEVYYCHECRVGKSKQELFVINGTSRIRNHLEQKHQIDPQSGIKRKGSVRKSIIDQQKDGAASSIFFWKESVEKFKELLIRWIVYCHIAFFQLENQYFRELLLFLNPALLNHLPKAAKTIRSCTDVNEQAERAQPIGLLSQLSGGQQLARLARIG